MGCAGLFNNKSSFNAIKDNTIIVANVDLYTLMCSGVFISDHIVLTARHCFPPNDTKLMIIKNYTDELIPVKKIVIHEDIDIMLLFLEGFEKGETIYSDYLKEPLDTGKCMFSSYVIGYGPGWRSVRPALVAGIADKPETQIRTAEVAVPGDSGGVLICGECEDKVCNISNSKFFIIGITSHGHPDLSTDFIRIPISWITNTISKE